MSIEIKILLLKDFTYTTNTW